MWVNSTRPHTGGVSLLRYALHFLVVILAVLLSTTIFSTTTHAADAAWESGKIVYDERSYLRSGPVSPALSDHTGIPEGSEHFVHIDDTELPPVHQILYFAPDVELQNATTARHAVFSVVDKGTAGETYTRVGGQQEVSLDQSTYEANGEPEVTSCVVGGIGYVICPVMNLMAEGMDKLFNVFKSLLHVAPLISDTNSGLYQAWSFALAIANVGFVIGFLIIIYSYITDRGVKQHDIRTILPRIIVAAILINASYYICALAVDISNILGANLQDIFNDIRGRLVSNDDTVTDPNTWSWSSVTTYILSGGTIGAGLAGLAVLGTYGTAALFLLMPMLVGAVTAILVVLVVFAARHALITVLIVLSPLAFTAFILPSTQKYFERWRSIFMTMLLMYPMFSLLFGGSQLAAHLIAQNATGVLTLLFAMFIQVAPLIITPFLIKFSGSILGRIAGMVNNPAKGLGDRAKNWSSNKAGLSKDRRVAEGAFGSGLARRMAESKRRDEALKKRYETMSSRRFNSGKIGRQLSNDQKYENDRLATVDKLNDAAYEELKRTDPKVKIAAMKLNVADMQFNVNKAEADTLLEELKSKKGAEHHGVAGTPLEGITQRMNQLSHKSHALATASQFAKEQEKLEYSEDMVKGTHASALQVAAAGITGDKGKAQAAARAVQEMRADFGKSAAAMKEMMDHFKLSGEQVKDLANMRSDVAVSKDGLNFTFKSDDEYTIDAAIESIFEKKGNYKDMREIVVKSGQAEYEPYLTTIVQGVATKMVGKAGFMGGRSIDTVTTGGVASPEQYNDVIRTAIAGGKFKQEFFATNDTEALKDVYNVMRNNMNTGDLDDDTATRFHENVQRLSSMAKTTLGNENLSGSLSQGSLDILEKIEGLFETK